MEKLSEKAIAKAMHDTGLFRQLKPAQMMHVLIQEIITSGEMKEQHFEHWLTMEVRWPEITPEEKMDEVLCVLQEINPTRSLQEMQKMGFMKFCMREVFPGKRLMDKKNYYDIIHHFDRLDVRRDDLAFKLAILLFPFDPARTEVLLRNANFDPDAIDWICNLVYNYIEFIKLNSPKKLRRFVAKWGKDFYFDMNDYAWAAYHITDMKELKPLDSRTHVVSWINQGVPLDAEDLDMTREDIIAAGAESEEEVFAIQHILLDDLIKHPNNNIKVLQEKLVKDLTQREIDRKISKLYKEYERN